MEFLAFNSSHSFDKLSRHALCTGKSNKPFLREEQDTQDVMATPAEWVTQLTEPQARTELRERWVRAD